MLYISFPPLICNLLEEYSIRPPKNQDLWLGRWLAILTILFLPAANYAVSPQIKTYSEQDVFKGHPELIIELAKQIQVDQPYNSALRTTHIAKINK